MNDVRITGAQDRHCGCGKAVAEMTLLLPSQQLEALENAATHRGTTTGQLVRRLIGNWLARFDDALSSPDEPPLLEAEIFREQMCLPAHAGDSAAGAMFLQPGDGLAGK